MIESDVEERLRKFEDINRVERELKRSDPNFKGFCLEVAYPFKLERLLQNYYNIMSQMPQDPGEEDGAKEKFWQTATETFIQLGLVSGGNQAPSKAA